MKKLVELNKEIKKQGKESRNLVIQKINGVDHVAYTHNNTWESNPAVICEMTNIEDVMSKLEFQCIVWDA